MSQINRQAIMITLIGTGHIFDLNSALQQIFEEKNPDVICVELDNQRYQALMNKKRNSNIAQQPSKKIPFIYRLLARFQQSMAEQYGVNPGDEMLTAAEYAHTHQIPLELIDMNAQKLFIQMWKTMPIQEKIKLIISGFSGFFVSKKQVEKELQQFQESFDEYIEKIGTQFPTIKHVLIDKRNDHMVKRLTDLSTQYNQIIACLGDGHLPGISKLLKNKNQEYETIRLQELRNLTPKSSNISEAHFSINYSSYEN
jgi:pheromone shutdown-related protein TraB